MFCSNVHVLLYVSLVALFAQILHIFDTLVELYYEILIQHFIKVNQCIVT